MTGWSRDLALAEAIRYRDRGWRPFPVDHPELPTCAGMHRPGDPPCPRDKRGKHNAVKFRDSAATLVAQADPQLRVWFGNGHSHNVGIACGASGIIVLDSDEPGALERLAADLGHELPRTYRVRTARDWHWYFDASDYPDLGNGEGLLRDYGINVRGRGGYVVAAGSLHYSGHIYRAEDDDAPALALPAWLAQAMTTKPDRPDQPAGETFTGDQDAPRYIAADQALQEFYESVALIQHQGNAFRQDELFPAALNGWRCVDNGWISERDMKLALADAVRRVWDAPPDPRDIAIINIDARDRAHRSPWRPEIDLHVLSEALPAPAPGAQELGDPLTEPPRAPGPDAFEELAYVRLRARRMAERRLDAEELGEPAPASSTSLRDLLAEPDEDATYLVDKIWPIGGKVILSAQQKAGKTTMVGNLLRALVDGDPVLGPRGSLTSPGLHPGFAVTPLQPDESVFVADFELDRRMVRRWLRDHRIAHPGQVHIETFRGQTWDVRDDRIRAQWARHLRDLGVRIIILDPLAPVLSSLNIDEIDNKGVGQFLHAMDALVAESGAQELLITHHTTHDGERGRGASVLRGWPDAEWRFVVERPDHGGEPEPGATRFFAAMGRDVAQPEQALAFEADTRTLRIAGGGRTAHAVDKHAEKLVALVEGNPGVAKRDLREALAAACSIKKDTADKVIATAALGGLLHVHAGPNRSQTHYAGPPARECARCWDDGTFTAI